MSESSGGTIMGGRGAPVIRNHAALTAISAFPRFRDANQTPDMLLTISLVNRNRFCGFPLEKHFLLFELLQ